MARLRTIALAILALMFAWDLAISVWFGVVPQTAGLTNRLGLWAGSDFIAFYAAARLAASGDPAAAYHLPSFTAEFARVLDGQVPRIPWPYPPTLFLPLNPLALLAPVTALWTWLAILAACAIAAAIAIARRGSAAALLVMPCVANNLVSGQNGTVTALLLAVLIAAWTRAPALAGIALGLLSYKPHLALAPGVLALAFGRWRLLAVASAVAAGWALLALLAYGLPTWLAFIHAASDQMAYAASGMLPFRRNISLFAFLQALGAPALPALIAHLALAGFALVSAVRVWRNTEDLSARTLALAAAVLVTPPYAYDYDLAILVLPAAALLQAALSRTPNSADLALFLSLSVLPILSFQVAASAQIQFAPIMLGALLIAALARAGLTPRLKLGALARS